MKHINPEAYEKLKKKNPRLAELILRQYEMQHRAKILKGIPPEDHERFNRIADKAAEIAERKFQEYLDGLDDCL